MLTHEKNDCFRQQILVLMRCVWNSILLEEGNLVLIAATHIPTLLIAIKISRIFDMALQIRQIILRSTCAS